MSEGGRGAGAWRRGGSGLGASGSYPVPQSTTQGGRQPAMLGTRAARPTRTAPEAPPLSARRARPAQPAPGSLRSAAAGARMLGGRPRDATPSGQSRRGYSRPRPRPAIFSAGGAASLPTRPTLKRLGTIFN